MFCGMSFLSANDEAEEQDIEVTEEEVAAAADDEIVNLEKVEKAKKTQDCGCK
jgi:hypothetical protein